MESNTSAKSDALPICAKVSSTFFEVACSLLDLTDDFRSRRTLLVRLGEELEAFMARNGGWEAFDQVVYVGDGGNDLCPALHLRSYVLTPPSLSRLFPLFTSICSSIVSQSHEQTRHPPRKDVPRTLSSLGKGGTQRRFQSSRYLVGRCLGSREGSHRGTRQVDR